MATSHLLATLESPIESSRPDLELSRRHWTRLAHLCRMTTYASIHDLFEPVLTLAELADYLHVPCRRCGSSWVRRRPPGRSTSCRVSGSARPATRSRTG
jgi:hypothetical protein